MSEYGPQKRAVLELVYRVPENQMFNQPTLIDKQSVFKLSDVIQGMVLIDPDNLGQVLSYRPQSDGDGSTLINPFRGTQYHMVAGNVLTGPDSGFYWEVRGIIYEDAAAGAVITPLIDDDGVNEALGAAVTVGAGVSQTLLGETLGTINEGFPIRNPSNVTDVEQLEMGSGLAADNYKVSLYEYRYVPTKVIP